MTRHAAAIGGQDAKNPPPPRHAELDHGAVSTGTPPARTRREEWPLPRWRNCQPTSTRHKRPGWHTGRISLSRLGRWIVPLG